MKGGSLPPVLGFDIWYLLLCTHVGLLFSLLITRLRTHNLREERWIWFMVSGNPLHGKMTPKWEHHVRRVWQSKNAYWIHDSQEAEWEDSVRKERKGPKYRPQDHTSVTHPETSRRVFYQPLWHISKAVTLTAHPNHHIPPLVNFISNPNLSS